MDFNLDTFLAKYKPKDLDLAPYLHLDKLKDYKLIKNNDYLIHLRPTETYIKYIKNNELFQNVDLKSHVKGGILLSVGTYINGDFYKLLHISGKKWYLSKKDQLQLGVSHSYVPTHLMLLFAPFPTTVKTSTGIEQVYEYDSHVFYLKINDCQVFYKYFKKGKNYNFDVELV
jgi:hypothetical protein